ncbi:MAG TPA: hypothetical protein VGO70_03555 [Arsenicitalea sp.]|jgi:uncharacterized protein YjiS (DUF1127 family)|nr:hypothetical protein [Arsenicitalea sp.]
MAFALIGERPEPLARPIGPLASCWRWLRNLRAARKRRMALTSLLEMDACRLDDLGISRGDILEAMHAPSRDAGETLSAHRAEHARAWPAR